MKAQRKASRYSEQRRLRHQVCLGGARLHADVHVHADVNRTTIIQMLELFKTSLKYAGWGGGYDITHSGAEKKASCPRMDFFFKKEREEVTANSLSAPLSTRRDTSPLHRRPARPSISRLHLRHKQDASLAGLFVFWLLIYSSRKCYQQEARTISKKKKKGKKACR